VFCVLFVGRRGRFQFYTGGRRYKNNPIGNLGRRRQLFGLVFGVSFVGRRGRFQFYTGGRRYKNKPIGNLGRLQKLVGLIFRCCWGIVAGCTFSCLLCIYRVASFESLCAHYRCVIRYLLGVRTLFATSLRRCRCCTLVWNFRVSTE